MRPRPLGLDRRPGAVRRAFTLTELLVVIAIIGVLAGLGFYVFSSAHRAVDDITAEARDVGKLADARGGRRAPAPRTAGPAKPVVIPDQYVIAFRDTVADPAAEAKRIQGEVPMDLLHVYDAGGSFRGFAANITAANLEKVKADPAVKYVEASYRRFVTAQSVPTPLTRIGVKYSSKVGRLPSLPLGPAVPRNFGRGGGQVSLENPVTVAVLDTGVDDRHPDLNVIFSKGFGNPDGTDSNGHGTHVAGTIAARHNSLGVVGVLPGAPIWNLKVLGPNGGTDPDIIAALQLVQANARTVRVANLSLGGAGVSKALNDAVDNCVRAGVVVVLAAGNDAKDSAGYSPASAPLGITVAALADSDGAPGGRGPKSSAGADDTFADFSNWGQVVDVIAPGVDILSTLPVDQGSYGTKSGTSMAAPVVAGFAARIVSGTPSTGSIRNVKLPPGSGLGNNLTPAQVLQYILSTADEVIPGRFDKRTYPLINARKF